MAGTNTEGDLSAVLRQAETEGWPDWERARVISDRLGVTLLRAHRLAAGWTLREAVEELRRILDGDATAHPERLGPQRLSHWEKGDETPSARYADALCRLYRTRPDRLGFGHDYSETPDEPATRGTRQVRSGVRLAGRGTPQLVPVPAAGRRPVTPHFPAAPGFAGRPDEETVRRSMDRLIEGETTQQRVVEWYEQQAESHGQAYRLVPGAELLDTALTDYYEMYQLLQHRHTIEFQIRLLRTAAQLAGLIGVLFIDEGRSLSARKWFHSAELLAGETGDRALRSWVKTRAALEYLYYGSPFMAARLAGEAQALAGSARCTGSAMAHAVEARALAMLKQDREAQTALQRAQAAFASLGPAAKSPGVYSFPERKLHFYTGNVLARTGATASALTAQQTALDLYPAGDLDRHHIRMDRAITLAGCGEPEEACRLTVEMLTGHQDVLQAGPVWAQVRELVLLIQDRRIRPRAMVPLLDLVNERKAQVTSVSASSA